MRVAFITDLHLNETKQDAAKTRGLLSGVIKDIASEAPGLVLLGGDYADRTSTPTERNLLVSFVLGLAEIAPVVAIRGNHDVMGDYDFLAHLRGSNPVLWVDRPAVVAPGREWAVWCLPWIDRSGIGDGEWHEGVRALYRRQLGRDDKIHSDFCFVLGHGALMGGVIRDGQPTLPTADPILNPVEVCPRWAGAAFWGHYHEPQEVKAPCPTVYGGALLVREYGEGERGWTLWDGKRMEREVLCQPQRYAIDIRQGVVVAVNPEVPGWLGCPVADLPKAGCYVKGRLYVEEGEDAAVVVASTRAILEDRFLGVQLEVSARREVRSRDGAAEVAASRTVEGKVRAYYASLQPPPEETLQAGSLRLLGDLEAGGN